MRAGAAAVVIALTIAQPAAASIGSDAKALAKRTPRHAWEVASAPFQRSHIRETVLCAGGMGALLALDEPIRRSLRPRISKRDRDKAHSYSAIMDPKHYPWVAGGLYGIGLAVDSPPLRRAGLSGLEGLLITSVFTGAVKAATGRTRPFRKSGSFSFRPFSGNTSFPSGHTSNAFLMATVIARSAHREDVSWAAYAVASSVAAARVIQDVHWTSDVVGAALLGTGIGWVVTAGHEDGRTPRLAPSFDPPGLSLVVTFTR